MAYTFTPPTYLAADANSGRLLSRYRIPRGYSVIKRGSEYETIVTPAQETFLDADFVYQGGHTYVITDEEAALLTAAGYSPTSV